LLSEQERDRRRPNKYRPPFQLIGAQATIPSFFLPIYEEYFGDLSKRLNIDMAILDYNYTRLLSCGDIWADERIERFKTRPEEIILDRREFPIALEFFLQIDGKHMHACMRSFLTFFVTVDLFYMKTCSFREAQPTASNRHLFCQTNPEARYGMTACGNCGLCYPKYDVKRRGQPVIKFDATHSHHFANKYQTILNCPCVSLPSRVLSSFSGCCRSRARQGISSTH
jgi:hypothetical protein